MNNTYNIFAQISIDLKKFRIRVHKESLHLIGDPEYIQFLVNVGSRLLAIRAVERKQVDLQTHKVKRTLMESDFSFEIYSRPFIAKLRKEFDCFNEGNSYRLSGTANQSERIAVFAIDSLQKIDT
jgi:hypothetical protein